jgi:hypothetical protein
VKLIDSTLAIVLHMANRKSRVSWRRCPMPYVSRSRCWDERGQLEIGDLLKVQAPN